LKEKTMARQRPTTPQAFSDQPRPAIPLNPVESAKVAAIGYSAATQTLAVQFQRGTGAIYHYPGVDQETYQAFIGAESIGRYFGEHIQGRAFEKFKPDPEPQDEAKEGHTAS
jgi:hypothetical protein